MKVLICGGTGFIGSRLSHYLLNQGLEVVVLARPKPKSVLPGMQFYEADLLKPELFKQEWFDGVDAVINLSGKNIFTYWSEGNKKVIWNSRVVVNKNLVSLRYARTAGGVMCSLLGHILGRRFPWLVVVLV